MTAKKNLKFIADPTILMEHVATARLSRLVDKYSLDTLGSLNEITLEYFLFGTVKYVLISLGKILEPEKYEELAKIIGVKNLTHIVPIKNLELTFEDYLEKKYSIEETLGEDPLLNANAEIRNFDLKPKDYLSFVSAILDTLPKYPMEILRRISKNYQLFTLDPSLVRGKLRRVSSFDRDFWIATGVYPDKNGVRNDIFRGRLGSGFYLRIFYLRAILHRFSDLLNKIVNKDTSSIWKEAYQIGLLQGKLGLEESIIDPELINKHQREKSGEGPQRYWDKDRKTKEQEKKPIVDDIRKLFKDIVKRETETVLHNEIADRIHGLLVKKYPGEQHLFQFILQTIGPMAKERGLLRGPLAQIFWVRLWNWM